MDGRHRRPRSPPLHNPGRYSMPTFGGSLYNDSYRDPYADTYAYPSRGDNSLDPRASGSVITTYKVKPEYVSSSRDDSSRRRLTVDSMARPKIISAEPRSPIVHGGAGRPRSPLQDIYKPSGELGGEYYTVPASSERH